MRFFSFLLVGFMAVGCNVIEETTIVHAAGSSLPTTAASSLSSQSSMNSITSLSSSPSSSAGSAVPLAWVTVSNGSSAAVTAPNAKYVCVLPRMDGSIWLACRESLSRVVLMKYDGNLWEKIWDGPDGLYTDLAATADGKIWLAFRDISTPGQGRLTLACYAEGNVSVEDGLSPGPVSLVKISAAGNDLFVVCKDEFNGSNRAIVKRRGADGTWYDLGQPLPGIEPYYLSLASDATTPWVALASEFSSRGYLCTYSGSGWQTYASDFATTGVDSSLRLRVHYGEPSVGFIDTSDNAGYVKAWRGSAWVTIGGGSATGGVRQMDYALDPSGRPWLVCKGPLSNGEYPLFVRTLNAGAAWGSYGADPILPVTANYPSIAMDSRGLPCIAFADYSLGEAVRVMQLR